MFSYLRSRRLCALLLVSLLALPLLAVDPPGILNHQGRIAVDGVNYDGTGYFKFVMGTPVLGATLWSNDGTSSFGSEPTHAVAIPVVDGHYTITLGNAFIPNMLSIPAEIFAENSSVALAIWFSTDNATFERLSPDRRLTSVPYALSAATASGVAANSVRSEMLADGAVTEAKIAADAVTTAEIADGSVTAADLATDVLQWSALGGVPVGFADGTDEVNDADADPGNELQSLSFSGNNLTLSNGGGTAILDNVGPWIVSGSHVYRISGHVGIGTASPSERLHVVGDIEVTGDLNAGDDVRATDNVSADGDVSADGEVRAGSIVYVDRNQTNDGSWSSAGKLVFGRETSGEGIASKRTSGDNQIGLDFYTGSSQRMTITNSGQVGIGTNVPGSALEVVSSNFVGTSNDSGIIAAKNGGSSVVIDGDDIQRYSNTDTPGTLFLNYYGGNISLSDSSRGATTTVYGTFNNQSDRSGKEDFMGIDPAAVLSRLIQLPLSTWRYKGAEARRHIGPVAQDFHAAFNDLLNLNSEDTVIAPLDEAGVAFASIQALHAKVEAENAGLKAANAALRAESESLRTRLERVEALVEQLAAGNRAPAD